MISTRFLVVSFCFIIFCSSSTITFAYSNSFSSNYTTSAHFSFDIDQIISYDYSAQIVDVEVSSTGNYFVLANSIDNSHQECLLVKLDPSGSELWRKTLFSNSSFTFGSSLLLTTNDGVILAGSRSYVDYTSYYLWLSLINSSGQTVWSKTDSGYSEQIMNGLLKVDNSSFLVYGTSKNNNLKDIFIKKFDNLGHQLWAKLFSTGNNNIPSDIITTSDGGFLLATYSGGDIVLIKTDYTGQQSWQKSYNHSLDYSDKLLLLPNNDFLVTGVTWNNSNILKSNFDIWMFEINDQGTPLWNNFLTNPESDYISDVFSTQDNGFLMFGYEFQSNIWISNLNSTGSILWKDKVGETDKTFLLSSIKQVDSTHFIAGGYKRPNIVNNLSDDFWSLWFVKISLTSDSVPFNPDRFISFPDLTVLSSFSSGPSSTNSHSVSGFLLMPFACVILLLTAKKKFSS